jgi:hypothetical protein
MRTHKFGNIIWYIWKYLPERFPQISIEIAVFKPGLFDCILIIHNVLPIQPVRAVHEPPLPPTHKSPHPRIACLVTKLL